MKGNGTSLEADQTNERRTSSAEGKGSVGEALHLPLWESHWGGSTTEPLDWMRRPPAGRGDQGLALSPTGTFFVIFSVLDYLV